MPKVLEKPTYTAAHGYNGFPLRSSLQFSSALGQLLPVWWHYLQPGDKVNCKSAIITRSTPLQSSAMVDIAEHIDWFFVPMEQMFKLFQHILFGVDDIHSSMVDPDHVANQYPFTDTREILNYLLVDEHKLDYFGYSRKANSVRLMQLLGYDVTPLLAEVANSGFVYDLIPQDCIIARSLWSALAYQKIYHTHYRLSDREVNNRKAYNLDAYYDTVDPVTSDWLVNIFELHYRPIRKDFFHGGFVSPLIGSENIGMLRSFNDNDFRFANSFFRQYLETGDSVSVDNSGGYSSDEVTTVQLGSTSLANLRQSFALEKLLEITRRAGKHIDEQTLAHFGVKVPQGISNEAYFLGSHDSEVVIGDVISTAGTDSDPLGQVVGKAYNKSKNFDVQGFEAKTHGVLMAIYSSDVPLHYTPDMCDRLNTFVNPSDFYMPEFDDLGMQPIFTYQGKMAYDFTGDHLDPTVYDRNRVQDWTYRYWELKLKYNRTCGTMYGNLNMWTVQRDGYNYMDLSNQWTFGLANYLVCPNFLDDIMLVGFDSNLTVFSEEEDEHMKYSIGEDWYEEIFSRDPLFHDLFIDVELASKMSTYGLPSL